MTTVTRQLQPDPGTVTAAGRRLETLWIAPARSGLPTLVVLHEALGSIELWKDFPQHLATATGCGVLVYSRWGHGRSERRESKRSIDYLHYEGEVALPAVLDALGIERPVLIGHSDGSSLALLYAAALPEGPAGLILEAPHVFVEEVTMAGVAAARVAYQTTDLGKKLARYHDDPDGVFWAWNDTWLDPRFRPWNIEAALSRIRCPVLLIQGESDEYGSMAQLDAIRRETPQSELLLLPECGHSPHRDQEAAVLAAVARFVEALR
ncbi:MAG TPA: alpha/beta hydrolase [Stellaceae bacterium]|nr:alpha/beta hydrolase [Stellaceae bacterium]